MATVVTETEVKASVLAWLLGSVAVTLIESLPVVV